jgi:hypothetical protein
MIYSDDYQVRDRVRALDRRPTWLLLTLMLHAQYLPPLRLSMGDDWEIMWRAKR